MAPHDYVKGLGKFEYKDGLVWVKIELYNLSDAVEWANEKYLKRVDKLPWDVADARKA